MRVAILLPREFLLLIIRYLSTCHPGLDPGSMMTLFKRIWLFLLQVYTAWIPDQVRDDRP